MVVSWLHNLMTIVIYCTAISQDANTKLKQLTADIIHAWSCPSPGVVYAYSHMLPGQIRKIINCKGNPKWFQAQSHRYVVKMLLSKALNTNQWMHVPINQEQLQIITNGNGLRTLKKEKKKKIKSENQSPLSSIHLLLWMLYFQDSAEIISVTNRCRGTCDKF